MTTSQLVTVVVGTLILISIPAMLIYSIWSEWGKKSSDRPSHTSAAAAFLGALDRIVRPSVEHQIEEGNRVVKEEDDVSGGRE